MDLTRVQTIGIETGISFTGVTTVTSLNATQGANISLSGVGVAVTIVQSGTGGYVQVGTSSTVAVIDNSGRLLMGIASTTSDSRAVFQASSGSATGGTNIFLQRGSTPASGEKLGLFAFADSQGKVGAEISAYADATWSLGDYPGRIVFSTTPDGSSTVTERLRIDDDGNLILASDTDTYIHHPAADTLAVTTGGSERLRIDSSGRVGLGTNSPGSILDIGSGAAVGSTITQLTLKGGTATGDYGIFSIQNGSTVKGRIVAGHGDDAFRFDTNGGASTKIQFKTGSSYTDALTIDSSQRVGIGTSSPSASALLDVNGSARIGSAGNFDTDTRLLVASTGGNSYIQIQGADSTGVVGLKLGRNSVANSAGIDWSASTDKLTFRTNGTTAAMTIDASQRVGIGVTSPADTLHVRGPVSGTILNLDRAGSYSWKFGQDANSRFTITADTSQVAAIDTSGRLLVGTTSARSMLGVTPGIQSEATSFSQGILSLTMNSTAGNAYPILCFARSGGTTLGSNAVVSNGDIVGKMFFVAADGTDMDSSVATIEAVVDGTPGSNDLPGRIVFSTTADGSNIPTERMRITQAGYFRASKSGSGAYGGGNYHEFNNSQSDWTLVVRNVNSSSGSGVVINYPSMSPNSAGSQFLYCSDSTALRAEIRSNGGLANYSANNANLSDRNAKKDISPAAGTWDCIKEWEIVNYHYKDQPDDADLNLGVIAQQVAESCPEVITVFEEAKDDQPEKLGIKEQQMYWMAIKALQEAQVRIEALEAEVAALKAQ